VIRRWWALFLLPLFPSRQSPSWRALGLSFFATESEMLLVVVLPWASPFAVHASWHDNAPLRRYSLCLLLDPSCTRSVDRRRSWRTCHLRLLPRCSPLFWGFPARDAEMQICCGWSSLAKRPLCRCFQCPPAMLLRSRIFTGLLGCIPSLFVLGLLKTAIFFPLILLADGPTKESCRRAFRQATRVVSSRVCLFWSGADL